MTGLHPNYPDSAKPGATMVVTLAAAGLIAAALNHWATPLLGPPLERNGYGLSNSRTGSRAYPREAVDSDGFLVRIPKPPRRIISQFWSIDEYLYSIVPPERVIGVSESAYLPGVSNVLDQVKLFRPIIAGDAERDLLQNPDLIIVSSSSRSDFTSVIRTSGIPVFRMFIDFTTLDQIEEYIRLTGYLTGEDDRAEEVARRFHSEIERAKGFRVSGARAPRVLGLGGQYGYGSHTLFDDSVKAIGAINVAGENGLRGYDMIDTERIARWNPEWIIAGAAQGQEENTRRRILEDPGVKLTVAGRTGHILVLENRIFLPMSPFASARATAMAEALWK